MKKHFFYCLLITCLSGMNVVVGNAQNIGVLGEYHSGQLFGMAFDTLNSVYISESDVSHIIELNNYGYVVKYYGIGTIGFSGDGGAATAAQFNQPKGITFDRKNNLYIADFGNNRIRKIDGNGIITTVAGNGSEDFTSDGVQATATTINQPTNVVADKIGNLYIADAGNNRIRKIDTTGIISTIAGTGIAGYSGDDGAATAAQIHVNSGLTIDTTGNLYFIDLKIRKISTTGIISAVAGNGIAGFSGDGVNAKLAAFNTGSVTSVGLPIGIATDYTGNVYFADKNNDRIRKIDSSGIITTIAGGGSNYIYIGENATNAALPDLGNIGVDRNGKVNFINNYDPYYLVCNISANEIHYPKFLAGNNTSFITCENTPRDINDLLAIQDAPSLIETWTIATNALHGTISASTYTTIDTVSYVPPVGMTYTPDMGYVGYDSFAIKVSDGDTFSIIKIRVAINQNLLYDNIIGSEDICEGQTVTYTDAAFSVNGYWESDDWTIFEYGWYNDTGIVIGYSTGLTTISFSNGCGYATKYITVQPAPSPISVSNICIGDTIVATNTDFGGIWSVTNSNISINDTGRIIGLSAGIDTISYTLFYTYYAGCASQTIINVGTPQPINGDSEICLGSTVIFNVYELGGVWSSSNTAIAITEGYSYGSPFYPDYAAIFVSSAGTATITYTNSCGIATKNITVLPIPAPIIVSPNLCLGDTITAIDSTIGGIWSTQHGHLNIDSLGHVTAIYEGANDYLVYTLPTGCKTTASHSIITNTHPSPIYADSTVCKGSYLAVFDTSLSGTWSSSNSAVINSSLYAVSAGTATITFTNACGSVTKNITVNPLPAPIVVSTNGCVGDTLYATDTTIGGTWSEAFNNISINAAGVAVVNAMPIDYIYYTLPTGCSATAIINISSTPPSPIYGDSVVCAGSYLAINDSTTGGVWSSSNSAIIGSNGFGNSAGTATITYSNHCGYVTKNITVNPSPQPIHLDTSVCVGTTTTAIDSISGGIWSAVLGNVTISGSGIVTGINGSTIDTIIYTLPDGCKIIKKINVDNYPSPIIGDSLVCPHTILSLIDSASGRWSSSNSYIASVYYYANYGDFFCYGLGTATITFTNSCGSVTKSITVNTAIPIAPIIGLSDVCIGDSITLTDITAGGEWSILGSDTSAIVTTGGIVLGLSPGIANVEYMSSGCTESYSTHEVIVHPFAGAIIGPTTTCVGNYFELYNSASGTWHLSNTNITITSIYSNLLDLYANTPGIDTITFVDSSACGIATTTHIITINPAIPFPPITGPTNVCLGGSITLADDVSGGDWEIFDVSQATITNSGIVTGLSLGSATVYYQITNACGTFDNSTTINVIADSNASFTNYYTLCVGHNIFLNPLSTGGVWSISNSNAILSGSGCGRYITGAIEGYDTVVYTNISACGTTVFRYILTIHPNISIGAITGPSSVCLGSSITLSDTSAGSYWWLSSSTNATISSTGILTGIAVGFTTAYYQISNTCGTFSVSKNIIVLPNSGTSIDSENICTGHNIAISSIDTDGVWSSSNTNVTITGSGFYRTITGAFAGRDTVTYTLNTVCGIAVYQHIILIYPSFALSPITGSTNVCIGDSILLSDSVAGGIWHSNQPAIATISTTGEVTGVTLGGAMISYQITNLCGTYTSTKAIYVLPNSGTTIDSENVCIGHGITLSSIDTGGIWSISNANVTITGSGFNRTITGVIAGRDTVTYTLNTACGISVYQHIILIQPTFILPPITGSTTVCIGDSMLLSDSVAGGNWHSSQPAIATISTTGEVTGVTPGGVTISYHITNTCGTFTTNKTIYVLPNTGTITDSENVCVGSNITIGSIDTGGIWNNSNANVTITGSGFNRTITGAIAGRDTVTYTLISTCGAVNYKHIILIHPNFVLPPISGSTNVCIGDSILLSDSVTGGNWHSSQPALATISTTGEVTGIAPGGVLISYQITNLCGTYTSSKAVFVLPNSGTSIDSENVCVGHGITISSIDTGGVWSMSNANVTITGSGFNRTITGAFAGSDTVTYTLNTACGIAIYKHIVIVHAFTLPSITGSSNVCFGDSILLSDSVAGGNWYSTQPAVATISTTGMVTGVSVGGLIISYLVINSCGVSTVTKLIYVLPNSETTIDSETVCVGHSIFVSSPITGGIWSRSNANVTLSGSSTNIQITGVIAGRDTVTYLLNTACGIAIYKHIIKIHPNITIGAITGPTNVCVGDTIHLSDTTTGGVWGSSYPTRASISSTGYVSGLSNGTTTIQYSVANICNSQVTATITINPLPTGTITAADSVCTGYFILLINSVTGGVWSVTNTNAIVVGSNLTGITTGIDTITYTNTNMCGTATTTKPIKILPFVDAGTITGLDSVCAGATITLTPPSSGGIWGYANPNALIAGGLVTGINPGMDTITYKLTNGCGIITLPKSIYIEPLPTAGVILGFDTLCLGGTSTTLTESVTGGIWGMSNNHVSISATGVITEISLGKDTALYAVSNNCGVDTAKKLIKGITIPNISTITGNSSVCIGAQIYLYDATTGGIWSASNENAFYFAVGAFHGQYVGLDTVYYTVTNVCGTNSVSKTITIKTVPIVSPIYGSDTVCVGATILLTDSTIGGIWSSTNSNALNLVGGNLKGVAEGKDTIIYTVTNTCGTSNQYHTVTIVPIPFAGIITANDSICIGVATTISDTTSGGIWSITNHNALLSADTITGIAEGQDTVYYTVSNFCGIDKTTKTINILPILAPTAGGRNYICLGKPDTLYGTPAGGTWIATNNLADTPISNIAIGITAGIDTFYYTVSNFCGTDTASIAITIFTKHECDSVNEVYTIANNNTFSLTLSPNPNNGEFEITQTIVKNETVKADIWNETGSKIYDAYLTFNGGIAKLKIANKIPGLYMIKLIDKTGNMFIIKFNVTK